MPYPILSGHGTYLNQREEKPVSFGRTCWDMTVTKARQTSKTIETKNTHKKDALCALRYNVHQNMISGPVINFTVGS